MKLLQLLPLAALGSAFVLPPEEVLANIAIEEHHGHVEEHTPSWYDEVVSHKDRLVEELKDQYEEVEEKTHDKWESIQDTFHNTFDHAYEQGKQTFDTVHEKLDGASFNVKGWLEDAADETANVLDRPHRPHHPHHKTNLTVYQLIAGSKYTTKLAKLINEYDDLVDALNSTKANYTVFAPLDSAFDRIPDHAPKPSKEFLKKLLSYHVVPGNYPAGRVLASHTAPTLFETENLGYSSHPQRIAFRLGLRGLTINFYSRVVAINIPGTNGVIHGIDSILVPPPPTVATIDLLPGEFSSLELGLLKTGLLDKLNSTDHPGGTLFAPSNLAFIKLGPRINAFLFSKYGEKYLKALLEYHVVPEHTLYSDAYIDATKDKKKESEEEAESSSGGYFHYDLPTLLKKRRLAVDVARYGRFISIKINAFSRVTVQDGIVADGVIQAVSNVLVPPKRMSSGEEAEEGQYWLGEEMSLEEFVERLEPYVPKGDL